MLFLVILRQEIEKEGVLQGCRFIVTGANSLWEGPGEGGWTSVNANYWPAENKARAETRFCIKSISRVGVYS